MVTSEIVPNWKHLEFGDCSCEIGGEHVTLELDGGSYPLELERLRFLVLMSRTLRPTNKPAIHTVYSVDRKGKRFGFTRRGDEQWYFFVWVHDSFLWTAMKPTDVDRLLIDVSNRLEMEAVHSGT